MIDVFVLGSRYGWQGFLPDPGIVWACEALYPALLATAYDTVPGALSRTPRLDTWYYRRVKYSQPSHPNHDKLVGLLQGWDDLFDPDPELFLPGLVGLQERLARPYRFYAPPLMESAMAAIAQPGDQVYLAAPDRPAELPAQGPTLGVWDPRVLPAYASPNLLPEIGAFLRQLLEIQPPEVLCDPVTPAGQAAAIGCLIYAWPYRVLRRPQLSEHRLEIHAREVIPSPSLALSLRARAERLLSAHPEVPSVLASLPCQVLEP